MMKNALCNKEVTSNPVVFNGQAVITTELLAQVYETETKHISNNFNRNKKKFIEGKHYILLQGEALKEFKTNHLKDDYLKYASQLYLWTERGASRHCKILDTDKAWEQFDYLEETYFKVRDLQTPIVLDQLRVMVKDILSEQVDEHIKQIEDKCSAYYRLTHKKKIQMTIYIKRRLGPLHSDEDYEAVKYGIMMMLGANKWQDIDFDMLENNMQMVEDRINAVKAGLPLKQVSFYE